jgi:hypothetical protein
MEFVCISTFDGLEMIRSISISKIYKVKFHYKDFLLIKNDIGDPQMVNKQNFVKFNKYINYEKK